MYIAEKVQHMMTPSQLEKAQEITRGGVGSVNAVMRIYAACWFMVLVQRCVRPRIKRIV